MWIYFEYNVISPVLWCLVTGLVHPNFHWSRNLPYFILLRIPACWCSPNSVGLNALPQTSSRQALFLKWTGAAFTILMVLKCFWLVVSRHPVLKNIRVRQLGWWEIPNISGKIKNWWQPNHQPGFFLCIFSWIHGFNMLQQLNCFNATFRHGATSGYGSARVPWPLWSFDKPQGRTRGVHSNKLVACGLFNAWNVALSHCIW